MGFEEAVEFKAGHTHLSGVLEDVSSELQVWGLQAKSSLDTKI